MRQPKGYRGIDHETIGSDVLSLVNAVLMPEQILGPQIMASLRLVRANEWYPIATLLDPLERLDRVLGPSSLRKIGWTLFQLSHEAPFKQSNPSARDIVYEFDTMYHRVNRGKHIGGWKVVTFEPGRAVLEKTTPHHCVMEEGIFERAFRVIDVPAVIYQTDCFRKGQDACRFVITSHVTDARWTGKK